MPDRFVSAELADRLAVLDDVGHDHDVVAALGRILCRGNRRPVQFAELAAEPHQIVVGQALAAKPQHQVLAPGLLDGRDCFRRQQAGQIDAFDIGAERRTGGPRHDLFAFDDRRHCRLSFSASPPV